MNDEKCRFPVLALLRMQSWPSPALPTGAYSYAHGLECQIEAGEAKILIDPFLSNNPVQGQRMERLPYREELDTGR